MRMVSLMVSTASLFLGSANLLAAEYVVNSEKSTLEWEGKKVSGSHHGTVSIKSGSLAVDGKGVPTAGEFVIDLNTIACEDLKDSKEWHDKLVGHLKSNDFFNVAKFPTAVFKITAAKLASPGKVEISGDLTVKGITKPITFTAATAGAVKDYSLKADFKIDRLQWDIRYNSGKFFDVKQLGDKMIYDDIGFKVDLVANQKDKA